MQLDSVRELKQQALRQVLAPLRALRSRRSNVAYAAMPVNALPPVPRLMALGIAPAAPGQFKLAVRLQRPALATHPALEKLAQLAHGELDVRIIGRVTKRAAAARPWHRERNRPLAIGGSIAHYRVTAGTLGAFVRARVTAVAATAARSARADEVFLLSNNHVLANENRARRDDAILQPGPFDGGQRSSDRVGQLRKFVALTLRRANRVDAALARLIPGIEFEPAQLPEIGPLKGVSAEPLDGGLLVAKWGRTTGLTRGRVTAFEVDDVVVGYDLGEIAFDGQIEIESTGRGPFSDGGDSGSLIVDRGGHAVALLFAGSDAGGRGGLGLTYASPIANVFDELGVELVL